MNFLSPESFSDLPFKNICDLRRMSFVMFKLLGQPLRISYFFTLVVLKLHLRYYKPIFHIRIYPTLVFYIYNLKFYASSCFDIIIRLPKIIPWQLFTQYMKINEVGSVRHVCQLTQFFCGPFGSSYVLFLFLFSRRLSGLDKCIVADVLKIRVE